MRTSSRVIAALLMIHVAWLGLACGGDDDVAPSDAGSDASRADAGRVECTTDAECDDGLFCNGEESCGSEGRCAAGAAPDCDDGVACTADACSEAGRECVSTPRDADGDGVVDIECLGLDGLPLGLDCDDSDADRYPGNTEVCDAAHDEDCDSMTYGAVDADADGHDDAACCNVDDAGATACGDDCDDADENVSPSDVEVCDAVDEDCDGIVDDIVDGSFVCAAGDSRACTTTCGLSGMQACADTCIAWELCSAPEVCNGCDDDADGADDDGFECIQGQSGMCTVPACGTTGTRLCSDTCGWGTCVAMESCNYCDDDADGNFFEERVLASVSRTDDFTNCAGGDYAMVGPGTICDTETTPGGFELWATLLDGTAVPQEGAWWLTPSDWALGWGPVDLDVEMEVTAVPPGGDAEWPLGGWAIAVAYGGTPGADLTGATGGVGAEWHWSTYSLCPSGAPPSHDDGFRGIELGPLGAQSLPPTSGADSCSTAEGIEGGARDFDGAASGTVRQRMQMRYTPDDPTTSTVNEESLSITASTPGQGSALTRTYAPTDAVPVGSQPLRIGIVASTRLESGFIGPPSGFDFGVPVRARFRVMVQQNNCCGPPTITFPHSVTRVGLCP